MKTIIFLYNCVILSIHQKQLPFCILVKHALQIQMSNFTPLAMTFTGIVYSTGGARLFLGIQASDGPNGHLSSAILMGMEHLLE